MMRRRSFKRGAAKPKDWVWTTVVSEQQIVDGVIADIPLMSAGTWEANANNFERATLTRIVGWVSFFQQVQGTIVDATSLYMAVVKRELGATPGFQPSLAGDYDVHDVMWTWGVALSGGSTSIRPTFANTQAVDIKVKRRITSQDTVDLVAEITSDAASPTGTLSYCLRCLINRA